MNARITLSGLIIALALIIVFLPKRENHQGELNPDRLLQAITAEPQPVVEADQLAKMIMEEDSSLLLIDLRSSKEYAACNIPGSLNIPVQDLLSPGYRGYLNERNRQIVFYSNDEVLASEAWVIARREGFQNVKILRGGLNEWFRTVMLSEYTGTSISPEENALFEIRYKARRFFTRMNSLPDSLKTGFLAARKAEQKKLVGGCE
ncbi:MAG: rhodanese-like domain-containing protein [Bacteroidales bacterium]